MVTWTRLLSLIFWLFLREFTPIFFWARTVAGGAPNSDKYFRILRRLGLTILQGPCSGDSLLPLKGIIFDDQLFSPVDPVVLPNLFFVDGCQHRQVPQLQFIVSSRNP